MASDILTSSEDDRRSLEYGTCKSWQYTPCWKKKFQGFRCKHMKALFPVE